MFTYQNPDRLPCLVSRPVAWCSSLIPEETKNVDWSLSPHLVKLLEVLVSRTIGVGSHVDQVGCVLTSKVWLVGLT